jgi:hypothetical protein
MPTQDLVHYRSENTYPVVRGNSSDNSSSLFIGSGAEDWVTRKRVETKTTKNIERRVQRQVGQYNPDYDNLIRVIITNTIKYL